MYEPVLLVIKPVFYLLETFHFTIYEKTILIFNNCNRCYWRLLRQYASEVTHKKLGQIKTIIYCPAINDYS